MKKLYLVVLISVISAGILFLLFGKNNKTENVQTDNNEAFLKISISPKAALPVSLVDASGNKIYDISQELSTISLPVGKNNYGIKRSGFDDVYFEVELYKEVSVVKDITLVSQESSIENKILNSLSSPDASISLDNGYWVKNANYYENGTWASGVLVTTDRETEGEQIILKFVNGVWEIVYAGTGFDLTSLNSLGVPQSVIDKVTE